METYEKIIKIAEKLPGYYGYRPGMEGLEVILKEVFFRLSDPDAEIDYAIILFFEEGAFVEGIVDARFSDGSIIEIQEDDEDFREIIMHKNKIMQALNRIS